jgi:hypothetical protein
MWHLPHADELNGFVEEIKEENRFDNAKKFPKAIWVID